MLIHIITIPSKIGLIDVQLLTFAVSNIGSWQSLRMIIDFDRSSIETLRNCTVAFFVELLTRNATQLPVSSSKTYAYNVSKTFSTFYYVSVEKYTIVLTYHPVRGCHAYISLTILSLLKISSLPTEQ